MNLGSQWLSCRVLTRLPLRGQRRLSQVSIWGTGFPFNRRVKDTRRHLGIEGGY